MTEFEIDKEYFPEDIDGLQMITNALINEKLILFIGAGISITAGGPDWKGLIEKLLDFAKGRGYIKKEKFNLSKDVVTTGNTIDYLIALHRLSVSYKDNKTELNQDLSAIFKPLKPQSIHYKIAKLNIKGIVTTNYDTLIEQADSNKYLNSRIVFSQDSQYDKLNGKNWIFKIHGDIDSNEQIIFPRDFSQKMNNDDDFHENYKSLLNTYTFLFIGFGLADPILMDILEQLKAKQSNVKEHFVLTPLDKFYKIKKHFYYDTYKLRLIPYEKKEGHRAVEMFIDRLSHIQTETNVMYVDNYILLVIHGVQHNTHDHFNVILTTTHYDKYSLIDENDAVRISYMLPSIKVENFNLKHNEVKKKIREKFHLNERDFEIQLEEDNIFEDIKNDPYSINNNENTGLTRFRFLPCRVTIKKSIIKFCNPSLYIGDVKYSWKSLNFLQKNTATIKFNNNVISQLLSLYGDSLEKLGSHMDENTPKIFIDLNEHLYSVDSAKYSLKDEKEFNNFIFSSLGYKGKFRLYDLGCGKAQVGQDIADQFPEMDYFGIDKNENMLGEIERNKAIRNFEVYNYDIFDDDFSIDTKGGVLLLKDVIHNISNLSELISQIRRKFHNYTDIIIVETISPDPSLKTWIQVLFERVDIRYKHHFFSETDLVNLFEFNGFSIKKKFKEDLYIDVDRWLEAKNVEDSRKEIAKTFIQTAPENVKKSFQIRTDKKRTTLLRQKLILQVIDNKR